ncbi:hypothetical protein MHYP_G00214190 [Metynnis hypsauchen]
MSQQSIQRGQKKETKLLQPLEYFKTGGLINFSHSATWCHASNQFHQLLAWSALQLIPTHQRKHNCQGHPAKGYNDL